MHEGEMTPITGRMECRRRLRQVIADDAGIADLLVADGQLVVGESDRARLVGELGVLERTRVQRDRAGLLTARKRDAPVQAPEHRELGVGNPLAQGIRGTPERRRGLDEVVLQQPRFRQRSPHRELVFSSERAAAEQWQQQLSCFGPATAFK